MSTEAQKKGAEELVQRARLYDQNAMGMIAAVRENAMAGDPTAQSAFGAIKDYIKRHPVQSAMGTEVVRALGKLKEPSNPDSVVLDSLTSLPELGDADAVKTAVVILANGRTITQDRLKDMHDAIAGEVAKEVFRFGVEASDNVAKMAPASADLPAEGKGWLCAGYCLGCAQRIQLARSPNVPPSIVSADIGWEMGCA